MIQHFKLYGTNNGGIVLTSDIEARLNSLVDEVNRIGKLDVRRSPLQKQAARDLFDTGNYSLREIAHIIGYKNASSVKWLVAPNKVTQTYSNISQKYIDYTIDYQKKFKELVSQKNKALNKVNKNGEEK